MDMSETTNTTTASLSAFWDYKYQDDAHNALRTATHAQLRITFDTDAEQAEFLALFPKSVGVKPIKCSSCDYEGQKPGASFHADFRSKKGNEVNETGIKRFLKLIECGGDRIEFVAPKAVNKFDTLAEALTAIGA